ncbi:ABC transporter substrate-binding protein [Sinomonas sp. ASV322]|uniref:ABC transporter substrate-binding protein n=1 Tax=Sinomonas sp. ASV322 TaxID=3041920 RepID=UPI0027DCDD0A|nr:ABC transporter substrate-binding protein [Sinomonas sp. ASV322]MDQ4501849.1 ABC transporter substrate-binding protein [Sinomonas sp. ASV322]
MSFPLPRRHFLALTGAGAGSLALAACGGPDTSGGAGATKTADADFSGVKPAASIDFWTNHPGKSQDVEKQLVEKFQAANPGITVNLVTAGSSYEDIAQKFQTAQAAKSGLPAVVVLSDVWWFRYYINGNIIPVDALIKQLGVQVSDYRDSLVKDYQYGGKQWAMPYARSTPLFYYNKDHFKAAGLPDRAPKTWDEFGEWAPKLMAAGLAQRAFQYGPMAGYAGWTMQNNLWGWGTGWSKDWDITCDSDDAVAAMQWIQDTVYKGKWAGVSSKDQADDFAAGIASATLASTGSLVGVLKNAKFNVGVGFLPGGPKATTNVCPTGGAGLGIPSGISKEQQLAAATFIKFVGEPENAALFSAATGYMPVRKSADMTAVLAKTPQIQTAIDQLAVTRVQDNARAFLPGADQEMGKTAAKILTQQGDVKSEMSALKKTLQGIYEKDVKPKLTA